MMYGPEKSDPANSGDEAGEQNGAIRCGAGGAKAGARARGMPLTPSIADKDRKSSDVR
jgi:hypothetical protein